MLIGYLNRNVTLERNSIKPRNKLRELLCSRFLQGKNACHRMTNYYCPVAEPTEAGSAVAEPVDPGYQSFFIFSCNHLPGPASLKYNIIHWPPELLIFISILLTVVARATANASTSYTSYMQSRCIMPVCA
jgi:hypothetical protein